MDFELLNDTMIVICDYLPKIYVVVLLILGGLVFGFVNTILNKMLSHFS